MQHFFGCREDWKFLLWVSRWGLSFPGVTLAQAGRCGCWASGCKMSFQGMWRCLQLWSTRTTPSSCSRSSCHSSQGRIRGFGVPMVPCQGSVCARGGGGGWAAGGGGGVGRRGGGRRGGQACLGLQVALKLIALHTSTFPSAEL